MVHHGFRHDQRRFDPDDLRVVQRVCYNNVLIDHQRHQHTAGAFFGQIHANHHAAAPDFFNNLGEFFRNSFNTFLKVCAGLRTALQQVFFFDDLSGRHTGRTGHLPAAKG